MWKAEDVVESLGGEWHGLSGLAPCPVCQPQRRIDQRGLSVGIGRNGALFYCHKSGCSFKYIRKALEQTGLRSSEACDLQQVDEARKAKDREQRDRARKLCLSAHAVARKRYAAHAFTSQLQTDPSTGLGPILAPLVLERLLQPFEVVFMPEKR